ncbi:MAG: toxic anion resistance protein, partial [Lachnospiraceae bacterium]|nr:toxic anion resistance protein [Lachnospiraceae bacterium]
MDAYKGDFKDFMDVEVPTPVLTFGTPVAQEPAAPVVQEKAAPAAQEPAQPVDPQLTEDSLTPEERKMVDEFSKQINLHDSNGILQYGAGTQKKMAEFSESALKNVRTKDLGEVGDMISSLVTELKTIDTEEEEKGLFGGLFKKNGNKVATMKAKYDKAEVNVEKICTVLEDHQVQLMKDVAVLDKMYALNLSYFKELSMYILAGKKRLEEVRATEVAAAVEKAQRSNLPEDAQAAKDLQDLCDRFEKKIHDLELTRMR